VKTNPLSLASLLLFAAATGSSSAQEKPADVSPERAGANCARKIELTVPADLVSDSAAARAKLKLPYISAGNQDGLISFSQRTHRYLKDHDVPHIWNVDDHGHDAETWGSNFYHFAQLIFR
jgi:hypothetical protein